MTIVLAVYLIVAVAGLVRLWRLVRRSVDDVRRLRTGRAIRIGGRR